MKKILLPLILLCVGILSVSCVREEGCNRFLDVRAADGNNSQINDVVVYIYDSNGYLIGFHSTDVATPVNIESYRKYGKIKAVAWSNTQGNPAAHTISNPTIGSSINDHNIMQNTIGDNSTYEPSDIFYGAQEIDFTEGKDPITTTVFSNRAMSSYKLTIKDIGVAADGADADYKVEIRHPYSGLDFAANPIGSESKYSPKTVYNPQTDELTSDINMSLPTGDGSIIIDIYSNGTLIYTITKDNQGNTLSLVPGKLHNILIVLKDNSTIDMIVTEWGKIVIFEGFS